MCQAARKKAIWIGRFRLSALAVVWALLASQIPLYAQKPGYPAPRHPDYTKAWSMTVEEILPMARTVARKPSRLMALEPGYGIKPGERALIVVNTLFEPRVLEAIRQAMVEFGAKVDVFQTHAAPSPLLTDNDGFDEIRIMRMVGPSGGQSMVRGASVREFVKAGGGYDIVINGSGGPNPKAEYRWEYIPWDTMDKFVYSMAGYPFEIQNKLDELLWDAMTGSSTIHATDPEGTDITWHWQPHYVSMLKEHWPGYPMVKSGHMSAMPLFRSPADANANGVIAGTTNHNGSYPHLKLTIQKNEIVKIEGGGEYGKRWQEVLDDCKQKGIQYPGFPSPGCGWFEEAAIGTDPWRSRDLAADVQAGGYVWERGRSGVIHWGLGVSQNFEYHPALTQWYRENSSKTKRGGGHNHVHTLFTTLDFTTADGKTIRAIDKGHLTFLDDPEVRKIAAKYGDPDEFLKEKWIPPMPGINLPGDYRKDYASDPFQYNHPYMEKLRQEAGWKPGVGGGGGGGGG